MKRDNLMQIVILIIAVVALILAVFGVVVPDDEDEEEEHENVAPTASISVDSSTVEEMANILFDASGSTDIDGVIVEYTWDFGDGAKDSGMFTNHAYSVANTNTVTLTVMDNNGEIATDTTVINVTEKIIPGNIPPVASLFLSATSTDMYYHINCDGSSSTDSDGTIIMYLWDFGDGTNSTGIYTNHYYTAPGTYTITLMATDDDGAKNSTSGIIIINDPGGPPDNDPPTASFETDQTTIIEDVSVQFNASGSSDSDGAIVEYSWDFGDGAVGSGIYVGHSFIDPGDYNVTLTVYDDDGASDTDYILITVESAAPTGVLDFSRTAPENYTGGIISLTDELMITDAYLYIRDATTGDVAIQNPVQSGTPFQTGAGLKLTYTDTNANAKFDGGDVWIIENGEHGDIIRLDYMTGDTVAEYTITITTPTGALSFSEPTPGNYTGSVISLSETVFISEASLFIEDNSTGINATQIPLQSGIWLQAGSGLKIKYDDSNSNLKIDAGDVWTVQNGGPGDIIELIYIPTGGTIASFTLS